MKNKTHILLLIIIFIMLIIGCSKERIDSTDKELSFLEMYPNVEFNSQIVLEKDDNAPNHELIGSDVNLVLKNYSDQKIEFSISKNLEILCYLQAKKRWVSINNKMKYYGPSVILNPQGTNGITDALVNTWPEILNPQESITLRIVTIGQVINGAYIGDEVGAYLDVTLQPVE